MTVWELNDPEVNAKTNQLWKTKLWVPVDQTLGLQGPASPICSVQNEFLTPCSRELHYLWVGQVTANPLDYYHYYHTNWYQVCELTQCFHSFSSIAEWVYGNVIVLAINQFIKVSAERPNRFCYAEWIAAPAKPGKEMGNCSCCRLKKSLFSFLKAARVWFSSLPFLPTYGFI